MNSESPEGEPPIGAPTMKDIGEVAGVSIFTVSRALNGKPGIAPETRDRVRRIAAELGYVPNQLARSLKGRPSRSVGVLAVHMSNQYYAGLINSIEHDLRGQGYYCIVMDAVVDGEFHLDRETAYVEQLLEQRVAAVVVTYSLAPKNLAALRDRNVQLVFVDTDAPGLDSASVTSDNWAGAFELGLHLGDHGYRDRWLFVAYPRNRTSRRTREAGFRDAAATFGVEVETVEGGADESTAYTAVKRLLDDAPETPRVLFAGNEVILLGALRAIREAKLDVPGDIALVSYDDFTWAPYMSPPLTVVDQNVTRIGSTAAELLLRRLGGAKDNKTDHVVLPTTLVVRESCGSH